MRNCGENVYAKYAGTALLTRTILFNERKHRKVNNFTFHLFIINNFARGILYLTIQMR